MGSMRRTFSREYRIEAVKLVTEADNSRAKVASDLGINPDTLCRRVRQYEERPQDAFRQRASTDRGRGLRQQQRENERLRMERDILKKAVVIFSKRSKVSYRFIRDHQAGWPVSVQCGTLKLSRSGYYGWQSGPESETCQANRLLSREIAEIYRGGRGGYGSPRVYRKLRRRGKIDP